MPEKRNWDPKIINDFFKVIGRHLGIFGHSGVGKTQSAFWLVSEFARQRKECIVWFDTGKSSDLLRLMDFLDVQFLIPRGRDVDVHLFDPKYQGHFKKSYFDTPRDCLRQIDHDYINVIMLRPFIRSPKTCSLAMTIFFETLIEMASEYILSVPMVLFLDEIQFIAPAGGHEFNHEQKVLTATLGHNIDQIRSWGVRFVGIGQDWGKVHRGVRNQFKCFILRQGVFFYNDAPRLARYNQTWETLAQNEFVFVFNDRYFSDPIEARFYGDGKDIGTIRYIQAKKGEVELQEATA